ncbi:SRPBCC family protein [Flavobacterium sp. RHBU_24]|uniref:SRPBCC family protein n=1 Tax=Flavobacterium sp. RHBU_24 TaxID=3391185 RepID=UPI003984A429
MEEIKNTAMKAIKNTIEINAPKEKVWQVLTNEKYYLQWYALFCEGTTAITDWKEGSKIIFAAGGMGLIGKIAVYRPNEELLIEMTGILQNGVEDYDSPAAKNTLQASEHYLLTEKDGKTTLQTSADIDEEYYEQTSASWDAAKEKIKELAESL